MPLRRCPMSLCARRPLLYSLFFLLLAPPVPASEAAASGSASTLHRTTGSVTTGSVRPRHAHRRVRRAPPGGVYARNAVVLDPTTDQILYDKHSEDTAPIASLSKLMTALVFLEQKPDLDRDRKSVV